MSLLIHPKRGPKGSIVGKVHFVAYHRNGIGGKGFHHVEFDYMNGEGRRCAPRLLAIVTSKGDMPNAKLDEAFVVNPKMGEFSYSGTDHFGCDLMCIINSCKWPHETKAKHTALIQS